MKIRTLHAPDGPSASGGSASGDFLEPHRGGSHRRPAERQHPQLHRQRQNALTVGVVEHQEPDAYIQNATSPATKVASG